MGHTDRASVRLFVCSLMTNMILNVVLSFLYPYNISKSNSSLSNLNLILGEIVVLQNRNIVYRPFALVFYVLRDIGCLHFGARLYIDTFIESS